MKKPPRKRQPTAPKAPAQTRVKMSPPRNLMVVSDMWHILFSAEN
jgi:hypothetical protein